MSVINLFDNTIIAATGVPGTCVAYLFRLKPNTYKSLPQNRDELLRSFGTGSHYCLDFFFKEGEEYDLPFTKMLEAEENISVQYVKGGKHIFINQRHFGEEARQKILKELYAEIEKGKELIKIRGTNRLYPGDRVIYGISESQLKAGANPGYWFDGRACGIVEVDYSSSRPIKKWWSSTETNFLDARNYYRTYGQDYGWNVSNFLLLANDEILKRVSDEKASGKVWA